MRGAKASVRLCLIGAILLFGGALAAQAQTAISFGAPTWNGNSFTLPVTVTNSESSGWRGVDVWANPSGPGVTVGGGGSPKVAAGGSVTVTLTGTISEPTGQITVTFRHYSTAAGVVVPATYIVILTKP